MHEDKIYVSLTSIFKNQDILLKTLMSIVSQTKPPNKLFLYLSEEPYILDNGFKNKKFTNQQLVEFIKKNAALIEVQWVQNTGSYRKLLPLLKDKWNEDCIIITIDDDTVYDSNLIRNLVDDYNKYKCVIGYRGFTPQFENFEKFDYVKHKRLENLSLYNFLTGKGGILYKPSFFHQTKDLIFNKEVYLKTCEKQDDIWFYIVRVMNKVKCYVGNKKYMTKDNSKNGLFVNFNNRNNCNANTLSFKNAIKKIKSIY